jgi:hypothetical protein
MMQKDGEMADIFKDPSYVESMSFTLSTSNMSLGEYFYGGFGPGMPGNIKHIICVVVTHE